MIIEQARNYKEQVTALLSSEKLPVADLPESLDDFLVGLQDELVVGVVGVEVYGKYGLLRSLVVAAGYRDSGIAGMLVSRIEALSSLKNLEALYLLTEIAPEYFKRRGFIRIERDEVPKEVQASSEFSHVCPVSAIVMKKKLGR